MNDVLTIEKPEHEVILRTKSKKVKNWDHPELVILEQEMVLVAEKWEAENPGDFCMGLAAPQVGVNKRVIMVRTNNQFGKPWIFMYNPIYIKSEGGHVIEEACMSVPGKVGKCARPETSHFFYYTRAGQRVPPSGTAKVTDLAAQILVHEIDHLNGLLYLDNAVAISDKAKDSNEAIPEPEAETKKPSRLSKAHAHAV